MFQIFLFDYVHHLLTGGWAYYHPIFFFVLAILKSKLFYEIFHKKSHSILSPLNFSFFSKVGVKSTFLMFSYITSMRNESMSLGILPPYSRIFSALRNSPFGFFTRRPFASIKRNLSFGSPVIHTSSSALSFLSISCRLAAHMTGDIPVSCLFLNLNFLVQPRLVAKPTPYLFAFSR